MTVFACSFSALTLTLILSELVGDANASSVFTYIVSHGCLHVSYLSVLRKRIIYKRITISYFMV